MFFKAANAHLVSNHERPERVIVLGTSGSMWDALLDEFPPEDLEEERVVLFDQLKNELIDRVDHGNVDEKLLDRMIPFLREGLKSEVKLCLIGEAIHSDEQIKLLATILEHVSSGDRIWIDVTHGYRHLPMLGMTSAVLAVSARKAKIENIFYGALEMAREDIAPVVSLSALLDTISWSGSLEQFTLTGRIRSLLSMLPKGELYSRLDRLEFLVSTNQIPKATQVASELLKEKPWEQEWPNLPIWPLIQGPVIELLSEVSKGRRTILGLCQLAESALKERDWLRGLLLIAEAGKDFELQTGKSMPARTREAKSVRNYIAHPSTNLSAAKITRKFLDSRESLAKCLRDAIKALRQAESEYRSSAR